MAGVPSARVDPCHANNSSECDGSASAGNCKGQEMLDGVMKGSMPVICIPEALPPVPTQGIKPRPKAFQNHQGPQALAHLSSVRVVQCPWNVLKLYIVKQMELENFPCKRVLLQRRTMVMAKVQRPQTEPK